MSRDTLEKSTGAPLAANRQIQISAGEPPHVEKWPRAWRYIFIIGGSILLWLAAILAGRWLA